MPDGHFAPLPQGASGLEVVRSGKFIDVEILGTIVAAGGVYDNITITNATIQTATVTDMDVTNIDISGTSTITNADITGGTIGALTITDTLTLDTGGIFQTGTSGKRFVFDIDNLLSDTLGIYTGLADEYAEGSLKIYALDLGGSGEAGAFEFRGPQMGASGGATNSGYGYMELAGSTVTAQGKTQMTAFSLGTYDALSTMSSSAAGSGDSDVVVLASASGAGASTVSINAVSTSGTADIDISADTVTFIGEILVPDGDQTNPGIAFTNDTNSGIYNLGADDLGIVAGGSRRLRVNATRIDVDNVSFLSLPVKATTGDPTGQQEGDMYVNTSDNALRLYADSAWRSVLTW